MAEEVKLPMVGGVRKKALLIGGVGAAGLVGFIYMRKRNTQASTTADTTSTDGTSQDPTQDYLDPGLQDTTGGPTYGQTGYIDPNTGNWVYGNTGTGQAAATTNAAWSQMAEQFLIENNGADPQALSAAIGKYLAGQPLTAGEISLVDQAIAVEGYPPQGGPNGYPPGIRESGTGTGQGGTGGSGGGVTGGGGKPPVKSGPKAITVAPKGLHVSKVYTNSAQVAWSAPAIPKGQGPLTGYGVEAFDSHGHRVNGPFKVGTGQHVANIGGLKRKTKYHVNVWCDPAKSGGPHASVSFTTK